MITQQQMVVTTRTLTLLSGAKYTLQRPSLAIRQAYVDYMNKVKDFTLIDVAASDVDVDNLQDVTRDMFDCLIDLMLMWLKKAHPEITREQIMEDFTDIDAQRVQALIQDFEIEIEGAMSPNSNRATRRAQQKKSTGDSSAAK